MKLESLNAKMEIAIKGISKKVKNNKMYARYAMRYKGELGSERIMTPPFLVFDRII